MSIGYPVSVTPPAVTGCPPDSQGMTPPRQDAAPARKMCESCGAFPAVYVSADGSVCWACFRLDTRVGFGDQRVSA